jgi:hypothetical protein
MWPCWVEHGPQGPARLNPSPPTAQHTQSHTPHARTQSTIDPILPHSCLLKHAASTFPAPAAGRPLQPRARPPAGHAPPIPLRIPTEVQFLFKSPPPRTSVGVSPERRNHRLLASPALPNPGQQGPGAAGLGPASSRDLVEPPPPHL